MMLSACDEKGGRVEAAEKEAVQRLSVKTVLKIVALAMIPICAAITLVVIITCHRWGK